MLHGVVMWKMLSRLMGTGTLHGNTLIKWFTQVGMMIFDSQWLSAYACKEV